jgi:hypothetical protein
MCFVRKQTGNEIYTHLCFALDIISVNVRAVEKELETSERTNIHLKRLNAEFFRQELI